MVREAICSFVIYFFNEDIVDDCINYNYIMLIPKLSNPSRPSDFCLIGLCNVVYKLVLKVLVNKLKQILSEIISFGQSAFILSH